MIHKANFQRPRHSLNTLWNMSAVKYRMLPCNLQLTIFHQVV